MRVSEMCSLQAPSNAFIYKKKNLDLKNSKMTEIQITKSTELYLQILFVETVYLDITLLTNKYPEN